MNSHLETVFYVITQPLLLIKIQWNLFGGYLPAPIKKISKGNAFFIFPPIGYFSCHFCAKFEEFFFCCCFHCVFSLRLSSSLWFLHLKWPWSRFGHGGVRPLRLQRKEPGRPKLCSIYPNTWPGGDLLWEDADIFHLPHAWMMFSPHFTQNTFSVNIWYIQVGIYMLIPWRASRCNDGWITSF